MVVSREPSRGAGDDDDEDAAEAEDDEIPVDFTVLSDTKEAGDDEGGECPATRGTSECGGREEEDVGGGGPLDEG